MVLQTLQANSSAPVLNFMKFSRKHLRLCFKMETLKLIRFALSNVFLERKSIESEEKIEMICENVAGESFK